MSVPLSDAQRLYPSLTTINFDMMARFRSQKSPSGLKGKPDILRKLGHIESFQSAQHSLELYVGCAISCRYVVPEAFLTSNLSIENMVEQAFARAILQHPLFTVGRVNDESKKLCWVRLDRIDLNIHVEWKTVPESEDYDRVLQDTLELQVNTNYTHLETRPQWRSVILGSAESKFIDIVFVVKKLSTFAIAGCMIPCKLTCLSKL
ncbi:hypothetical protein NOF04DRAFT_7193 [Fusarium oxysporum II5]|uniref:Condensation domain-containing protein n=1 Tax=Fusarium odoratissimum (strain NRRL 54006) TaxID=1089451 RepID=X0J105_FUSO5|nr:uncharacterized protein FOIG_16787 [Fusarium odoratissimum NRRL 54006]EXL89930.1 hypothetical protein FOIG_16787 [Fusarium odoratissimum NRRL 54006]KAK2122145.1 hypothetical protein NOF04DRAFT_7193 [Fusarium oxysporum II5]